MPKGVRSEPCKECGSKGTRHKMTCSKASGYKPAPMKAARPAPARAVARVTRAKPGAFNAAAASVEDLVATIEACQEDLRSRKDEVAEQLAAIEKAIGAAA